MNLETFLGKHESIICIKCEKRLRIPNDDVVACLKSQIIDWIPLCLAIWNIIADRMYLRQNHTWCLNTIYFSHNHSNTNKSANLLKRQAIAGQRTVKLSLIINDAHNPNNNPTVLIADPRKKTPYCQEIPQLIGVPFPTKMDYHNDTPF